MSRATGTRTSPLPTLLWLALAAFYIGLLLNEHLEKTAAACVVVAGLAAWIRDAETRRAMAAQTGLFLVFAAMPAAVLLSWLGNGMSETGVKMLGKYARFLLVLPVYAVLWRWLRPNMFWHALLLTAAVLALWNAAEAAGWVDVCREQQCWPYMANGAVSHTQYGGLSLAFAAMLLAGAPGFFQRSRALRVAAAVATTMVLFGVLGAGNRTAYLALFSCLLFWALLVWWRGAGLKYQMAGVALGVAFAASLAWPVMYYRTMYGLYDLAVYQQQEHPGAHSIGLRFLAWRASSSIFAEHPWLGVGPGQFRPAMQAVIASGALPRTVVPSHPHSEHWAAASTRGRVGLLALLAVFALPAWHFLKTYMRTGSALALAGVLMVAVIAQLALTESIFQFSTFSSFYVMTVAALTALLQRERLIAQSARNDS